MFNIGCHLSVSKGYEAMGKEALSIHANTFQFFTRNPRGGAAKDIDPADAEALRKLMDEHHFAPILAHAAYTLNLCSSDAKTRELGKAMMKDDLERLKTLPCYLYNFHPGSHTGQGIEKGIKEIVEALNAVIDPKQEITILLEGMSGKGSEVGGRFEELKHIIDGVKHNDKMGVCLDTCHVYSAGYDIVNALDEVVDEFDQVVGIERLRAIHLNDSMTPFGSHKDRHEKIGKGTIGLKAFAKIINHPKLKHLPFYLETPNETDGYAEEIKALKALYK